MWARTFSKERQEQQATMRLICRREDYTKHMMSGLEASSRNLLIRKITKSHTLSYAKSDDVLEDEPSFERHALPLDNPDDKATSRLSFNSLRVDIAEVMEFHCGTSDIL